MTKACHIKKVVNKIDNLPKIVLNPAICTKQFLDDLKRVAFYLIIEADLKYLSRFNEP